MESSIPAPLSAIQTSSECELLLWVQTKVDRSGLEEIAANGRGDDAAKHLAAIQEQLRPRPPMGLLPWWPLKVLELERCRDPDHSSKRGHVKRLLACTVLLRNAAYISAERWSDEGPFLWTSPEALVKLTGSALVLDVPKLALGFILWLLERQFYAGARPFAAFCAIVLATVTGFGRASEQEILEICDWVDNQERQCRSALGADVSSTRWLVGINLHEDKVGRKRWSSIAKQVLEHPKQPHSERVRERLRRMSNRLEEN